MNNQRALHEQKQNNGKTYLIGGGIASLAAAAFLIRDADVRGQDIVVVEALDRLGGSLDGAGSPQDGYVLRGGRMIESKYLCTFGLFSSIPTLDGSKTVTEEIFDWNRVIQTDSKSRLVRNGHRVDGPDFGLSEQHILTLERVSLEPESMLGRSTIADQFADSFFQTNFWLMWCTTFAFQPWHSVVEFRRYLLRFAHMVSGFNHLHGIMRTVYNQYDSLVLPLRKWLEERGVGFRLNTRVSEIHTSEEAGRKFVDRILYSRGGEEGEINLAEGDRVIVTIGSMTDSSSLGSMDAAPVPDDRPGPAWQLWEKMAKGKPEFGKPAVFAGDIQKSKWVSFTTTQSDDTFFRAVRDFTGNIPGEGGLITFADSAWLLSIVLPHQPHFIGQPEGVNVFWGYGLSVDKPGNFVNKPMSACTGREIMTEVLGQLGLAARCPEILPASICIPCMMPFITSQFLPRAKGDRPEVIPEGWTNLALVGQFCEIPDDVVFTVEYSIRAAQLAVYQLFGIRQEPPAVYKGQYDPRVLYKALKALHDI